jgi:phospholipid/cholesterol/gamma-HCH transport system substrate-binding protein
MGTLLERDELISILGDFAVVAENARNLSAELEDTNRGIRDMAVRADSTFAELSSVVALARDGEGSVARLLRDPDMAEEVESTLQSLRLLLDDIRENPRRYLRLSIF